MAEAAPAPRQAGTETVDVTRYNLFASSYLSKCRTDASMSGCGTDGLQLADWEVPDWGAPAPEGWWQVVHRPCVWAFKWEGGTVCPQMEEISQLHREGEVLAMTERRWDDLHKTDWLRLRDCGSFGEQWLPIDGRRMGLGLYDFADFIQPLQTGSLPPSAADRSTHEQAIKGRQTVRSKVQAVLNLATGGTQLKESQEALRSEHLSSLTGCAASEHSSALTRELLMRSQGEVVGHFARRLVRDGYAVADDFLPEEGGPCLRQAFVEEMVVLTGVQNTHQPPQQTAGQRDDGIVWVDEALAGARYGVPAVAAAVALLKGLADALNPSLTQHAAERREAGDPVYLSPPCAPASTGAVLTVPLRAMAACYPGRGGRYIPHTDNKYRPGPKSRANARELTAILYANPPDWEEQRDGGSLRLFPGSQDLEDCPDSASVTVAPLGGRLVVFFSALWHEVMPAWRDRRALTLWIFRPDEACVARDPAPKVEQPAPKPQRSVPGRNVWQVVGGGASGGITVRMAASLTSEELGKLEVGARVQQVAEAVGGRLQFMKLEGQGPEQGWVSLTLKGKPLLRREDR